MMQDEFHAGTMDRPPNEAAELLNEDKEWLPVFDMISLSAGALSVRYSKLRDRLSHTVGMVVGDSYIPLLESIEGSEEEPWPASPPMQQMVEECFTPGASPVLLGVGLSGNGHWSTAIDTQKNGRLKFDIACKNTKSSTWFGSQYRLLAPIQPSIRANSFEIFIETARMELSMSIGKLDFLDAERRVRVSPLSEPSLIQTHRWCYEISLMAVA